MKTMLIMLIFIPNLAFTQTVYKCQNTAGLVNFQQLPCADMQKGEEIKLKVDRPEYKPEYEDNGLREGEIKYLQERDKEREEIVKKKQEKLKREEELLKNHDDTEYAVRNRIQIENERIRRERWERYKKTH